MAEHPNVTRCRELYEIFDRGNMEQVRTMLGDEIVWHVPGRGRWAGPKRGVEEVFAFFEQVGWEASSATFSIELRDVVADDHHMVALVHYHHERDGRVFDQDGIESYTLDGTGHITEFSAFIRDSAAFDEFFS